MGAFRSDSGLLRALLASGMDSSLMAQGYFYTKFKFTSNHNIVLDDLKDNAAMHGGCPVIAGNKWIINKWVMTFAQWNKLPCDTQRLQRHKVWPPSNTF